MNICESTKVTSEALSLLPVNEVERTARQRFRCSHGASAGECVVALPHNLSATRVAIPVELCIGPDVARTVVDREAAVKRVAGQFHR
jgi:hypothetical protein